MSNTTRLVIFGCSFTYGSGLPDCVNWEAAPSKHSWTQLVADKLGYTLDNQGCPGGSNLEILYKILNYKFITTDQVIIMWSLPMRDVKFKRLIGPFRQVGTWMTDSFAKKWMMSASEYDYEQRSWLYMHHAQVYLDSINVKHLHAPSFPINNKPRFITINNLLNGAIVKCDTVPDGHPGVESNKRTAERILNIYE
jgi:hypothetical protein